MNRAKSNGNGEGRGIIALPIGFRFHPTDQELILHYLKTKLLSFPLPAPNLIPESDVFQTTPWDLPGDPKVKRYFFCKRKRVGCRYGYWKSSGKDREIVAPGGGNIVIGIKKSFFFSNKNTPTTQWIMHHFCLLAPVIAPQKLMIEMGDWVVCRVYQRKMRTRSVRRRVDDTRSSMRKTRSVSVCEEESACSSVVTEISVTDLDLEVNSPILQCNPISN